VKRNSRSVFDAERAWRSVFMVCGALFGTSWVGCASFTERQAYPTAPVRAAQGRARAELVWLLERAGAVVALVRLEAPAESTVARAVLVQPPAPHSVCPARENGCDPLDPRFTTGTVAKIDEQGSEYVLLFPRYGALHELAKEPRLLLDVKVGDQHQAVELALDPSGVQFRSGNWGLGGAIRYRPPAAIGRRVGNAVTGELGAARWLGRTRLYLGYEIGLAGCRARSASEDAQCRAEDDFGLFGSALRADYYLRLDRTITLGLGLGYVGLFVAEKDSSLVDPAFRHGPRLSLQLLRTPQAIRRFADEPPRLAGGPELTLELLFRDRFAGARIAPGAAWAYGVAF